MKKTVIAAVSIVCVTAIIITGLVLYYDYKQSERQLKFDVAKEITDIIAAEPQYLDVWDANIVNRYFDDLYQNIMDTIEEQ